MATTSSKPNVVCISLDSVRADEVSFGAGNQPTTPNMECLSSDATVFKNAISPSTWTLPVHASVMTGLYPPEHGVIGKNYELGNHPTLGELFSQEGYNTKAFYYNGWLKVGNILRGFDHDENDRNGYRIIIQKIHELVSALGIDGSAYHLYQSLLRPQRDAEIIRRGCDFIQQSSEPFFSFIHLNGAHYKYLPPRSVQDRFTEAGRRELFWNQMFEQYSVTKNIEQYWVGNLRPASETTELMRELYRACIYRVDELVGNLLQVLDESGYMKNTIIIVFGDHGDNFGEDGQYGHHFSVSDGVIRVPLIVYDPTDYLTKGASDELVQTNDLYPTLSRMCGIEPPETRSVNLTRPSRNYACTYYILPDDATINEFVARLENSEPPPRMQFAVWQSPQCQGVWYPTKRTYEGDESLRDCLSEHIASLDTVKSHVADKINDDVIENLRRMGYVP